MCVYIIAEYLKCRLVSMDMKEIVFIVLHYILTCYTQKNLHTYLLNINLPSYTVSRQTETDRHTDKQTDRPIHKAQL